MTKSLFYILFLLITIPVFISCSVSKFGKDKVVMSAVEKFLIENFKELPLKSWENGALFECVTEQLPTLLIPCDNNCKYDSLKGKEFVYTGVNELQTWNGYETHIQFECNSDKFYYKTTKSTDDIFASNFTPLLPELVSKDYIALADSLLGGKTLYVKTSRWYDSKGDEIEGLRLVPVVVKRVVAGNKIFPLAIVFETQNAKEALLYTTMFKNGVTSQYTTFDKLFSFDNPRDRYPNISEDNWNMITRSKVAEGMTKDECMVSLGLPEEVNQIPEYSGLRERWLYSTGTFLEFKDGLLVKFRLM